MVAVVVVMAMVAEADTATWILPQLHILTLLYTLVACNKVGGANNH